MKRGILIVLEGCDRVGKSTQLKRLTEGLRKENIQNEIISFPNRTTVIGQVIDKYLTKKEAISDKAIHLLFSADRWELEPKITKLIAEGMTLIVDRYSFSGVAFSTAKKNMDLKWCWQPEIGLPKPDLVLFLNMPLKKAAARNHFGEEIYDDEGFQKKVVSNFLKMVDSTWQVIDADRDVDTVHKEILKHVIESITKVDSAPLLRFT